MASHRSFEQDTLCIYPDTGLEDAAVKALRDLTDRAIEQVGVDGILGVSFGNGAARVDDEHPELWRPAVSVLVEPLEPVVVVALRAGQCPSEISASNIAHRVVKKLTAEIAAYAEDGDL